MVDLEIEFPEPAYAARTEEAIRAFRQTLIAFFERYPPQPVPAGDIQPDVLRMEALSVVDFDSDPDVIWLDPAGAGWLAAKSGVPDDEVFAAYALIFL